MKHMLLVLLGFSFVAGAGEPAFDPELARQLGADERGMKSYVLCILKTGPKDAEIKGDQRKEIFAGHFANIERLANEGKLAVAGPFGKNDQSYRGLYIFNVPTIEEAGKLVMLDPAVKAGVFVPELTPWYGSAAMMVVSDTHKRITRPAGEQKVAEVAQCSQATLNGDYVYAQDGFKVLGGNDAKQRVPFAQAGKETFDGAGKMHGTYASSENGAVRRGTYTAVYTMNADCSGTLVITEGDKTFHYEMFATPDGNEIVWLQTDDGSVSAGWERRK